jgi:hypothetical protein
MFVVRYVALLALVLWLGALLNETAWIRGPLVGFACGGVLFASLVALKFLGPPPRSFVPRAAIVALMSCIAVYARYNGQPALTMVNVLLGGVLLGWYARE